VTDREARLAKNEALFRGVNEKVREVRGDSAGEGSFIQFICECGRGDCVEQLQVTLVEYERVRSEPEYFLIKPGHELLDVEFVSERNDRFLVVRKQEEEAQIARETDPRS
jgi:hypothetical protein